MMSLEEAASIYDSVPGGTSYKRLAVRAYNAHQFRESDQRTTPSQARLDGAEAELRLLRVIA